MTFPSYYFRTTKLDTMDSDKEKFPQQGAPEKNTDHAFVQVGRDGHPVIPETTKEEKEAGKTKADPAKQ